MGQPGGVPAYSVNARLGPVAQWVIKHFITGFTGFTWASMFVSAVIATER
jgi:hypothetical protein